MFPGRRILLVMSAVLGGVTPVALAQPSDRTEEREAMVSRQIEARGVSDAATLTAMRAVPRHEFIPRENRSLAYYDTPIPIGHGQTISQPYIVGYMTEMLGLEPDDSVLEIGTGSGYQAAVLAEIVNEVHTVEIIPALARSADETFTRLNLDTVQRRESDGYYGWAEAAPFDAIIVTAAASHVPPPLVEQLAPGGRMIIPVGTTAWTQNLVLIMKDEEGTVRTRALIPVRFVPLTGEH